MRQRLGGSKSTVPSHLHANCSRNNTRSRRGNHKILTIREITQTEKEHSKDKMIRLKQSDSDNKLTHSRKEQQQQTPFISTMNTTSHPRLWRRIIRIGTVIGSFCFIIILSINGISWISNYLPINLASVQAIDQKHFNRYKFDKAAIASEHPICSNLGKQVMQKGGSAVDAAIVALLCIGVINNQSSGIGGGGFMLIRSPGKDAEMLDFRETAPRMAYQDMFKTDPQTSRAGGMAVAVPGEVAGMHDAHSKYGILPWKELFDMVASVAREGFPVSKQLHLLIVRNEAEIREYKELSELYMPHGKPLQIGDILKRENLASTLELIGKEGWEVFYKGRIAESIVAVTQKSGGILTLQDMAEYKTIIRPTIKSTFDGTVVITGPAPTGGPVLLHALNIIEGLTDLKYPFHGQDMHLIVEALKFAYATRMKLGDPSFNPNMDKITRRIVDKRPADKLRHRINKGKTYDPDHYASHYDKVTQHGTTHVSVVDANGLAVSATSTINLEFGNLILDPSTGILLNSEMDDFSIPGHDNAFDIPPSVSNYIVPGKRPQSSCAPVMLERNGELILIAGGTGGSRIISSLVQLIVEIIRFGGNPIRVIAPPRLHHQLIPNILMVENEYNEELVEELKEKGHLISRLSSDTYLAAVQLIEIDPHQKAGRLTAVADPRKGGSADGF